MARKLWILFDVKPSVFHATPRHSYKQMVEAGMPSDTCPTQSHTGNPTNTAVLSVLVLEVGL